MSDFDIEDIVISTPQQPKQVAPAPMTCGDYKPAKRGARTGVHPAWVAVLAFLTVTFALLWITTWLPSPGPGPGPNVDPVDGAYVAIFYDDKEKSSYSQEQLVALDSAAVAQFLDETVTGWKKIDVDQIDELKNLAPIYAEMAEVHRAKLPWVVIRAGKRLGNDPITNADDLIALVKRTVK